MSYDTAYGWYQKWPCLQRYFHARPWIAANEAERNQYCLYHCIVLLPQTWHSYMWLDNQLVITRTPLIWIFCCMHNSHLLVTIKASDCYHWLSTWERCCEDAVDNVWDAETEVVWIQEEVEAITKWGVPGMVFPYNTLSRSYWCNTPAGQLCQCPFSACEEEE